MKDYIEFHCPNCGSKIFLCVSNKDSEIFKETYNCTNCGDDLNIEYDKSMDELNIKTRMSLRK